MISRRLRYLIPGGAVLASLTGCVGASAPLERYRLAPVPATSVARAAAEEPSGPTIAVEPYATTGIYADPQIVYRLGETTYGAYPNREWALPLGTMLADATIETMHAMPELGARVTDERAFGRHELIWRGVVQQFEEVDRGQHVAAAVKLDAALVRMPGDSVVWQGTVGLERSVANPTMPAIVDALSQLTSVAIRRLVGEAHTSIQSDTVRLSGAR